MLLALALGCSDLTAPVPNRTQATTSSPEVAKVAAKESPPEPGPEPAHGEERISATHLLIMYQGSMRAPGSITRTKSEARALAERLLARIKQGDSFDDLVRKYSDEPGAATRAGKLRPFKRGQLVRPFADAAFALGVGQLSGVVETPFGFHIIRRDS